MKSLLRSLVAIFGMVVLAVVAGCSSSTSEEESTTSADYTPVTIEHEYGSTTFDAVPTKVLSLSTNWTSTLLSLDVPITAQIVPQGYAGPNNRFAWLPENDSVVEVVPSLESMDIGTIAKFDPDIILAGYVADKAYYDKLNELAPTIPVMAADSDVDQWQDIAEATGKIFDKADEAQQLIDDTNANIETFKSTYPGAQGKSFVFTQIQAEAASIGVVNSTADAAAGTPEELGFTLYEPVAALHEDGGRTRGLISNERTDLLNADLLIAWTIGDKSDVERIPGWNELTAVQNDTVVYVDNDNYAAFGTPSAASIEYIIELLTPAAERLNG